MMSKAWKQLAEWRAMHPELANLSMSVNVSPKQFASLDLIGHILTAKQAAGLDGKHLRLEITESSIMQNAEQAGRMLQQIRAAEIRLLIDDFGTGYSLLSCLHHFPLDGLKIDRSFVRGAGERHEYAAVLRAIVTLTQSLNIQLIAEGVETAEQVELLRDLGCDQVQGYYFSRQIKAETVPDYLNGQLRRRLAA